MKESTSFGERVRAARIERYKSSESVREAEKAFVEEQAKRNAEVLPTLDALFDSMDEMQVSKFSCPKCKAACEVPVRGKNVLIHCSCGQDFEVFC